MYRSDNPQKNREIYRERARGSKEDAEAGLLLDRETHAASVRKVTFAYRESKIMKERWKQRRRKICQ